MSLLLQKIQKYNFKSNSNDKNVFKKIEMPSIVSVILVKYSISIVNCRVNQEYNSNLRNCFDKILIWA